jgi:hypothetical protein
MTLLALEHAPSKRRQTEPDKLPLGRITRVDPANEDGQVV